MPDSPRFTTWISALLLAVHVSTQCGDANPEAPKFWKDIPEQADVLAATFLGGKGNEWLVSGGFQPDGTVVVVGNVIGPFLNCSSGRRSSAAMCHPSKLRGFPK